MTDSEPVQTPKQQMSEAIFWSRVFWTLCAVSVCVLTFEFFRHIYEWLKYGETQKVTLLYLFGTPEFKWIGIQKLVSFIWNMSIWMIAFVATFVSGWLAGLNDDVAEALRKQA